VVLIAFAEGLGLAKTYAQRNHYTIDANRELFGLGAANIGAGVASGMVVNGSLSKTAVNGASGAQSQVSGLFVAVLTVLTMLFLTGLFEDLPEATLAAIVIAAVIELVDFRALARLWNIWSEPLAGIYGRVARADLIAAVAAMLGVLVFGTLPGLFIGISVSVLLIVYRASRPHVAVLGHLPGQRHWVDIDRHTDAVRSDDVLVLRPESGLFFANADNVHDAILGRLTDGTRAVVLDLESVPAIDVTAARMLVNLDDELTRSHRRLLIAREVGQIRDVLRHAGAEQLVERVASTVDDAVTTARLPGEPPPREEPDDAGPNDR
jgi:MFS superfamily sulfate permease-like transporter